MTTDTNALSSEITVLFQKLIDTELGERNDWREVLTLCNLTIDNGPTAKLEFNTDNRGVKSDQFAVLHCAKWCPTEKVGTKAYKGHRKNGMDRFNKGTARALAAANLERGFAPPKRKRAASETSAPEAPATSSHPEKFDFLGMGSLLAIIEARVADAQKGLEVLRSAPAVAKLGMVHQEAMAAFGVDLGAIAKLVRDVGELVTGATADTPETAANDLQAALRASIAPATTAPSTSTPQ